MTRKDYVMIADAIKGALNYEKDFNQNEEGARVVKYVAHTIALSLQFDNPRFDRDRFLVACGVK
jgi:hypothetical protein